MCAEGRGRQPNPLLLQAEVRSVRGLTEDLFLLDMTGFPNEFDPAPGTFLHLKVSQEDHPLLRRPISIQSYVDGVVTLLIREVGAGTRILHHLRPRDLIDALGPLGRGFSPIGRGDRVLMVGGGVGVAPLVAACHAAQLDSEIDFCYGGKNIGEIQDLSAFEDRKERIRFRISTDDGSLGYHGFCTDLASQLVREKDFTRVLTCGPWIMMRKVAAMAREASLPLEVSLEVQMGCGLGACLSCVYRSTDGEFIRSCIDGPVVDGHTVCWDEE